MIKRLINITLVMIFAFMLVGCVGDEITGDSKVSSSQVSTEDEVSSTVESRVEIIDKLSEEQKQSLIKMIDEAEEVTKTEPSMDGWPVELKEEQDLVPVILAQTDNIKFLTFQNRDIEGNNSTFAFFFTSPENLLLPKEYVEVGEYKVYKFIIMYNLDFRDYIKCVSNNHPIILSQDGQSCIDGGTNSTINFVFKMGKNTCCVTLGYEDSVPPIDEIAQRIKEDFVCKHLSEL